MAEVVTPTAPSDQDVKLLNDLKAAGVTSAQLRTLVNNTPWREHFKRQAEGYLRANIKVL